MLDKTFGRRRKTAPVTIGRDFGFAVQPTQELVTVISKLLRTTRADVIRFEFVGQGGKDTGFQLLASKPVFPFAVHQRGPLIPHPLLLLLIIPVSRSSIHGILLLTRTFALDKELKTLLLTRNCDEGVPGTDTHGL